MASGVPPEPADHARADTTSLTGSQISAINRFPDDNPNPVLRIDGDGRLTYANPASAGVLRALGIAPGELMPGAVLASLESVTSERGFIELSADGRTWAVWPVAIPDLGFTNVYGRDVTAERAIVKFPDENPNPVMRIDWDGRLTYANPASGALVTSLGLEVGGPFETGLASALIDAARAGERAVIDVDAGERSYRLLPVSVPAFGFVNIYGTDVTAEMERERLARENERLLLNILPEPIARRLRDGEPIIADRFDDVTLLFADIVEFTRLSSTLTPSELVNVLNEVFTVFDRLVDRYGLEKVKTIGDAYMVVGGMSEPAGNHTARVAAMALDLADAVGRIEAARRFGIAFRIGIHCGPVVAGVIGIKKFIYDIWGDTVNLASRMESLGEPGRVQVTYAVKERLGEEFQFKARGLIDVKGKGPMPTWFLGERPGAETALARIRSAAAAEASPPGAASAPMDA